MSATCIDDRLVDDQEFKVTKLQEVGMNFDVFFIICLKMIIG
jgi:hypothetical protein